MVSYWLVLLCESEIIRDLNLDARVQRTWVDNIWFLRVNPVNLEVGERQHVSLTPGHFRSKMNIQHDRVCFHLFP